MLVVFWLVAMCSLLLYVVIFVTKLENWYEFEITSCNLEWSANVCVLKSECQTNINNSKTINGIA